MPATMDPRRVAAVLLVSLALAACGRTGIKESSPETTAAPGGPKLLIRLDTGNHDWFTNQHVADYLTDGTVIRWANPGPACEPGRPCGTLQSNTLTMAGLTALRALLADDADLLSTPMDFKAHLLPGVSGSGRGPITNSFILDQPNGQRYAVNAPSARSADAGAWAPDPAIERLNALAEAMIDPVTLAGPAGLTNPVWEKYQPAKMAVFIRLSTADPRALWTDRSFAGPEYAEFSEADWPLQGLPDAFGTAFDDPNTTGNRCGFVAGTDIEGLIAGLPAYGGKSYAAGDLAVGLSWGNGGMLWRAKSPPMIISLWIVALLPEDGAASCLDARSY